MFGLCVVFYIWTAYIFVLLYCYYFLYIVIIKNEYSVA
jgi:hypothetical protein